MIGPGSYMMGFGAPGSDECTGESSWDCHATAIPSGPSSSQPTRILGAGWDSGCPAPPEFWGAERTDLVLDLRKSSHVELACFQITDHSSCVEFHSGTLPCQRDTPPFGPWAAAGIVAEDSGNVVLKDLDIHGLAGVGIRAGRLTGWTVERVRVAANGWAGWDGDIEGADSNSGSLTFRHFTVEWNGCGETYPAREPTGCWAQTAGGYGDGLGTGETAGTWVFEDSAFLHNTSDGLDLLYARAGSNILITRTRAEGNAGNQLKTDGPAVIENSIIVGNCGFFHGKPFTFDVDDCRAVGNALSLSLRPGDLVRLVNNTVAGHGDCLVLAGCFGGGACTGTERVRVRNGIFLGEEDFLQPGDRTCLFYQEGFPHEDLVFDANYNLFSGVKDDACPGDQRLCGVSPGLLDASLAAFDAHLLPTSPAVGFALREEAPVLDFDGRRRDAAPDLGAYESEAAPPPTNQLFLSEGRVAVGVTWRNQYNGATGVGTPVKQMDQYGYFWFDSATNPEVFVKVLDFGGDSFLVFHSSLSDLEYTVTFTVLRTAVGYSFERPAGSTCGLADGQTVRK